MNQTTATPQSSLTERLRAPHNAYMRVGQLRALLNEAADEIERLSALSEKPVTWEPCGRDDPRYKRADFVINDSKYIKTVRSNGDTYDHFIAPAPEFK